MGQRLVEFYSRAQEQGGVQAKIKVAMLTKIPSTRAAIEPDSPENIKRFEAAFAEIGLSSERASKLEALSVKTPALGLPTLDALRTRGKGLQDSEEWFWGILSSMSESMVAVFDRAGACLFAWESLSKKYGLEGEEERQLTTLVPQRFAEAHPAALRAVFEGRPSTVEHRLSLSRGEAWLETSLSPMSSSSGEILAVVAFFRDISERRRVEASLRQSEQRLRRHNTTFLGLMAHESIQRGDLAAALPRITEAAAATLEVARASVWLYHDERRTSLRCADLFIQWKGEHSSGIELREEQFPAYFAALGEARTISASDAHSDPRTREFSEPYLSPLGIGAMLDVPIWHQGRMAGVVCHEHIGEARHWSPDEENFAYLMASIVSLALR